MLQFKLFITCKIPMCASERNFCHVCVFNLEAQIQGRGVAEGVALVLCVSYALSCAWDQAHVCKHKACNLLDPGSQDRGICVSKCYAYLLWFF